MNEFIKSRGDKLAEIARTFDLELIYAFGSHAGDALKWLEGENPSLSIFSPSDLDIGIKPAVKTKLSVKKKIRLAMALEDLFLVSRVDLVSIPEADPFLAANIIRGERLFSQNTFFADEYELYLLRRAGDLVPLERERIAIIMGEENESE